MMQPDIIATIQFYPTNKGGRNMPILQTIFKCPFKSNEQLYDCALLLKDIGNIYPGDMKTVPIKFLNPILIKPQLTKSSIFSLWDGKDIAAGIIDEIC